MRNKLLSKPKIGTLDSIMETMIKKPTTRIYELSAVHIDIDNPLKIVLNRYDYFFTSGMSLKEQEDKAYGWRTGDIVSAGYRKFFREHFLDK